MKEVPFSGPFSNPYDYINTPSRTFFEVYGSVFESDTNYSPQIDSIRGDAGVKIGGIFGFEFGFDSEKFGKFIREKIGGF